MNKNVYAQNFSLIKELAPEMIMDSQPDYYLEHRGRIDPDVITYVRRNAKNCITLGTFWPMNGDRLRDPCFEVMFDCDRHLARVQAFDTENIGILHLLGVGEAIYDHYECTFDTLENEREKFANEYLRDWLLDIVEEIENDKEFFQHIVIGEKPC